MQVAKSKSSCGLPEQQKVKGAFSETSRAKSVKKARHFFLHRRRIVPAILGLYSLQTSFPRTDQERRVELLQRVHDAEKLNVAIGVESFPGSSTMRFLVPVSAPLFRLTADQFDWQTRPMPDQQEIS
jgi:hypothetical protein